MNDPYEVLGLKSNATETDIEAAYKRLAQIFHPDRYSDSPLDVRREAERRMKELNDARRKLKRKGDQSKARIIINCAACGASNLVSVALVSHLRCVKCDEPFVHSSNDYSGRESSKGGGSARRETSSPSSPPPSSSPNASPPPGGKNRTKAWISTVVALIVLASIVGGFFFNESDQPVGSSTSADDESDARSSASDFNSRDTDRNANSEDSRDSVPNCVEPSYVEDKPPSVDRYFASDGVLVKSKLTFYGVTGCSRGEIRRQINSQGPRRSDTFLNWWVYYEYRNRSSYLGPCRLESASVEVRIDSQVPHYQAPARVKQSVERAWDRYISALAEWNSGLRAIYVEAGESVLRGLYSLDRYPSCRALDQAAETAYDSIMNEYSEKAGVYTRDTPLSTPL